MTCCTADLIKTHTEDNAEQSHYSFGLDEFLALSQPLEDGKMVSVLTIGDMRCAACIQTIEKTLNALKFTQKARANLSNRSVTVIWDMALANQANNNPLQILTAVENLGYEARLLDQNEDPSLSLKRESQSLLYALAVAGFAAANIMLLSVSIWSGASIETTQIFHLISGLIAVPSVLFAGRPFFKSAFTALKKARLNMDVPISLAVLLTLGMSIFEAATGGVEAYFDASIMLLFFLLIGRYLDHKMRIKAHGAVERLSHMAAKGANQILAGGKMQYLAINEIEEGMVLRIAAGERVPVNGKIVKGQSDFDKSLITGESHPVFSGIGKTLEAGLLNLTGAVDMVATSSAKNSYLAEIKGMMEAAQQGRGHYVRIAEKMARIYAPAVHLLAAFTFLAWMFYTGGDWHLSIYTAIAVLIITCPCALGLAVPVTHVVAASRLFAHGIMMRDGSALERLCEIDSVAFDKTGTLTKGVPTIKLPKQLSNKERDLIAALSAQSNHPLSKAIHKLLKPKSQMLEFDTVEEIPGFGIEAKKNGKIFRLGRPSWVFQLSAFKDSQENVPQNYNLAFTQEGQAPIFFESHDALRKSAKTTIEWLTKQGLKITILSGDSPKMVQKIAALVHVKDFFASLTPKEKIKHIESQNSNHHKTLMVGDGVNDAPALAAGHVSMAPASASDVGRLASDLIFTRQGLDAVSFSYQLALKSKRVIMQNFALALLYNLIAVPLAMFGLITPLFAAIAMSASSIVVVANSLRLNLMKLPQGEDCP